VHGEEARSNARLMAALMFVHVIAVVFGIAAADAFWRRSLGRPILLGPDVAVIAGVTLLILLSFCLVRSARYRLGVGLYMVSTSLLPLVAPFVGHPRHEVALLAAALVPIIVAAMMLSHRWLVGVTATTFGVATVELLTFPIAPDDAVTGFAILIIVMAVSVLMLVLRIHYGKLAALRVRQLRDSEAAVRASEQRLRELLGASRDLIVVLDETGARRAAYGAIEAVTGYRPEERGPVSHFEAMHPDDLPRVKKELAALLEHPGQVVRTEWRQLHKDGRYRWLEGLATNRLGAEGVDGIVVNIRDVSDRRSADEALRQSEQRYRTLFGTVTDGIFVTDGDGRLTEVNDAACRMLGYSREELLAMWMQDIAPSDKREDLAEVTKMVAARAHLVFEASHRRKDGSIYPAEVAASLTEIEGKPAFLGVARDITERRRIEVEKRRLEDDLQQAVKIESIGRLAGGVAHDFNNMLTAVLGNVQLAERRAGAGQSVTEALGEIREAAMSAAALTRQLLAFSRKQVVAPRLLDMNELIERMQRMLVRLIGEDVELRTIPGTDLRAVRADPGLLEQVVVNLVINARDAMPNGGVLAIETANVRLDAEYRRAPPLVEPGPYVKLAVSDTGMGMSDDIKSHLFEPFFTTKPRGQGTGLGLATSYGAIRQSNGTIEVYSEPGKGTTFTIYLPVVEGDAEALPTSSPDVIGRSRRGTETILVAEDDERVRDLAARALSACGYEVLVAESGDDALALAREHTGPIHLLLSDVVMPGMNGRQLSERLLQLHPETRTLFTSGYTEDIIAHHGVLDPGIEFLTKPYSLDVLAQRVRRILDKA
jgi:PAS domain S-box-containing protein